MRHPASLFILTTAILWGCETPHWFDIDSPAKEVKRVPVEEIVEHEPIDSRQFILDNELVGELQVLRTSEEDTFVDIARVYDLGYDELRSANPGVDPWLPGEGTPVYLPTLFLLPDTPREGLVVNIASRRLYYYPATAEDEPQVVVTNPIGIGRAEWSTPLGVTTVTTKIEQPTWYPPASIRQEHAELDDPLPSAVPPGPDNPLGEYALLLGIQGYLLHGTNKTAGVGMRVSHGCIRLYPEDIEPLFGDVAVGTKVRIVNQPYLAIVIGEEIWLEVHEPLEEDDTDHRSDLFDKLDTLGESLKYKQIDIERVEEVITTANGIPVPITVGGQTTDSLLAAARPVENIVIHTVEEPVDEEPVAADGVNQTSSTVVATLPDAVLGN